MLSKVYGKIEKVIYFYSMMVISFSIVCMFMDYTIWNECFGENIAWSLNGVMTIGFIISIFYNGKLNTAVMNTTFGLIMASVCLLGTLPAIVFMIIEVVLFFLCIDGERKQELIESSSILYISVIFEIVSICIYIFPITVEKLNYRIFSSFIIDVVLIIAVIIDINKTKLGEKCKSLSIIPKRYREINNSIEQMDDYGLLFWGILGLIGGIWCTCIFMMNGKVFWDRSDWMMGEYRSLLLLINLILFVVQFFTWYLFARDYLVNSNRIINLYIAFVLVFISNSFISLFMSSSTMLVNTMFVLVMYIFSKLINNFMLKGIFLCVACVLQAFYSIWNRIYAMPFINFILFVVILLLFYKLLPIIKKRFEIKNQNILMVLLIMASVEILGNFIIVKDNILYYEDKFFELNKLCDAVTNEVGEMVVFCDDNINDNEIKYLNSRNIKCEKKYTESLGDNYAVIINNENINSDVVNAYIVDSTKLYTCLVRNEALCADYSDKIYLGNLEPNNVDLSIVDEKWNKDGKLSVEVSLNRNLSVEYYNNGNVYLSYHIFDENHDMIIWDGTRSSMDNIIKGENQKVSFDLSELEKGKKYYYEIDIIEEGVRWFSIEGMETPKGELVIQ